MKILIINPILSTSEKGVITRRRTNRDCMIYNFARGFIANGHDVTVFASEEYRPLDEEDNAFEVVYFKSCLPRVFKPHVIPFPKGMRKLLKRDIAKYDLVIASESFQIATLLAADICRGKLVIWQELSLHNRLFFKLPSLIWYNIVMKFPAMKNALIVPRSNNAKDFIKKYSNNVTEEIVDHGANAELFNPSTESDSSFVVIARLVKGKNIDKIIRVFADFVKLEDYSKYVLNIVGDGPEYDNLKQLISELGIHNNVRLRGYMTHKEFAPISAKAKALLINTSQDLNMVSIPESIVNGTPVLMNTLPNTTTFIQENRLGIAKDDWGAQDLIKMVKCYDEFHANCIRERDNLTNIGCARKMIDIFCRYKNKQ